MESPHTPLSAGQDSVKGPHPAARQAGKGRQGGWAEKEEKLRLSQTNLPVWPGVPGLTYHWVRSFRV